MQGIEELRRMTEDTITPNTAARYLKCNPQLIRTAARQRPELLGFPVSCIGNRVKIPRVAFIKFLEGKT